MLTKTLLLSVLFPFKYFSLLALPNDQYEEKEGNGDTCESICICQHLNPPQMSFNLQQLLQTKPTSFSLSKRCWKPQAESQFQVQPN